MAVKHHILTKAQLDNNCLLLTQFYQLITSKSSPFVVSKV